MTSLIRRLWNRLTGWRRPPLGLRGENLAAKHLRRQGFRIVSHGEKSKLGEIDLIAKKGNLVVFVEVKTRATAEHGEAWQAVDARKQHRVARLAVGFLQKRNWTDVLVRFDVIGVTWDEATDKPTLEHFEDAFPAPKKWVW